MTYASPLRTGIQWWSEFRTIKVHFSDISVIQMFVIQNRNVIKIMISYFVQVTVVLGVRRNVFRATKKVTYHETAQKEEAR